MRRSFERNGDAVNYVLDTTLLIDIAHRAPAARALLESLFGGPDALLTCDVIVAEALSKGDDDHLDIIRTMIAALEYVATDPAAAAWAGERRRAAGRTSPRNLGDALIAGVAVANKATIVTRNPDDFQRLGIPVRTYG
jgi:predicted nucleic acid-binding protein